MFCALLVTSTTDEQNRYTPMLSFFLSRPAFEYMEPMSSLQWCGNVVLLERLFRSLVFTVYEYIVPHASNTTSMCLSPCFENSVKDELSNLRVCCWNVPLMLKVYRRRTERTLPSIFVVRGTELAEQ
jgi:hypothetical protein